MTMATHVPTTTRYARARMLALVQCAGAESWPTASGPSSNTEAHAPRATDGIGATRARKRDWRVAAIAQLIAISASRAVAISPAIPSVLSGEPIRTAVPASPKTRPSTLSAERRSPLTRKWARTAVQTGAAAPNTATSPLGTNCSDQKMIAQLQPKLMRPTRTATAIVRPPRGKGSRRATATTVSTEATATVRTNANTNAGQSFTPILIAAQVVP